MTMLRDAVTPMMLALLAVLCATTAVSAECAWVLWVDKSLSVLNPREDRTPARERSWDFLWSSTTKTECEQQLRGAIDAKHTSWQQLKATKGKAIKYSIEYQPGTNGISKTMFFTREDNTVSTWIDESLRYLCLPDTIDPRAAKGR